MERGPRGPRGRDASWLKSAAPYFGSVAIAIYVLVTGHARDNRIIESQKDGRTIACQIAREDHKQDLLNVKATQQQLDKTKAYLKTVKDPTSDINIAVRRSLPGLVDEVKQAKAGIDAVPSYCNEPNLGLPS